MMYSAAAVVYLLSKYPAETLVSCKDSATAFSNLTNLLQRNYMQVDTSSLN